MDNTTVEYGPRTGRHTINPDRELELDAAHAFFERCCVVATPDAVAQLVDAFLPALKIISERGYDRDGKSWREQGWRGQLFEVMKRVRRLEFHGWGRGRTVHEDSAVDLMNYAGFLIRQWRDNPDYVWGEFGEPV